MNAPSVTLSRITVEEAEALSDLSKKSFADAFIPENKERPQNVYDFIDVAYTPERLKLELTDSNSQFYFARDTQSSALLGYMKLNFGPAQTEIRDPDALEVERLYLTGNQVGKGTGQVLFDKAIEIAIAAGLKYVWLGVWEHNLKARKFYTRNGFTDFDSHIFTLGEDDQTDILMKRVL